MLELIKELRERTGAGFLDCKKALQENQLNLEAAIDHLKIKGLLKSEEKAKRTTDQGLVYSYIHHDGQSGVLLELNCETDFVARTEEFRSLAHNLALHIVAAQPKYVSRDWVPVLHEMQERELNRRKTLEEGKPEKIADKIVEGRMSKFYQTVCLLEQEYILDDSQTVEELIKGYIARLGENIKVKQFSLFKVGTYNQPMPRNQSLI